LYLDAEKDDDGVLWETEGVQMSYKEELSQNFVSE
jgi:hypothetical protein